MPFIAEQLTADGVTTLGRIVWTKAVLDTITAYTVTDILSIVAGGSGYVVGETFEINDGTAIFVARGEVLAVGGGGAVTSARITSSGAYSVPPTISGSPTTNASASGDNALVVSVNVEAPLWIVDNNTYVNASTDFQWIAHSTKADLPPYVGMRTKGGATPRIFIQGQLPYNSLASFAGQPGKSPGDIDSPDGRGACINAAESDPVLFLSQTERRIVFVMADPPRYQLGYAGLFVPFTDDPANYPYPMCVAGTCIPSSTLTISDALNTGGQSDVRLGHSSIVHPWIDSDIGATDESCYYIRDNLSPSWLEVDGGTTSGHIYIWPAHADTANATLAPQVNSLGTDPFALPVGAIGDDSWFDADGSGANTPGVAPFGAKGRSVLPIPLQLIKTAANQVEVIGYIDGVYAVHGRGLTEEDRVEDLVGTRLLVFPDVGGAPLSKWCAIAEV